MAASMRIANIFVNNFKSCGCQRLLRLKKHSSSEIVKQTFKLVQFKQLSCSQNLFALSANQLKKSMESLTDKFAEAREMLGDARESKGTVYFSEDMEEAQTAVIETLEEYQTLLSELSDEQRKQMISTLGLRMEELKAQLAAIEEELKE